MARPPETYPFTKGEFEVMSNSRRRLKTALGIICVVMVGAFLFLILTDIENRRPDWQKTPNAETRHDYDYYWAKEGLIDYRYGILDPKDAADHMQIVGYCAALIPDIKAALADGKLTYLEVHNLKEKAKQLDDLHDFQVSKNEALTKMGKPLVPVMECPDGKGLWPEGF